MQTLVINDEERDFILNACIGEIDDFETDGGVYVYYRAAKSLKARLSPKSLDKHPNFVT